MTMTLVDAPQTVAEDDDDMLLALSRPAAEGQRVLDFAVPDAYCATCISSIETALTALPQVQTARVNLSTRRVRIGFDPTSGHPRDFAPAIVGSGYRTYVLDPSAEAESDPVLRELVRALAVSGFAAGNIMLFSVSVWSGADPATRDLFHWLSALIALPAIAYAGRPFFRSAFSALRVGRTNMDVPISIGVCLATALSLYETVLSGAHAYFDASTMLLFFLLVGRTLDHLMRVRARSAVENLARIQPRGATRILEDGAHAFIALADIEPGMVLQLKPGERVPVDCAVLTGHSSIDLSVASGESAPVAVTVGDTLAAGAINLSGAIGVTALRPAADSFIARMSALMQAAEGARTGYRRLADRVATMYAPVVHLAALTTFLLWGIIGGDWHTALLNAVAVLIITCPCALALAVPIVHVVAAGRLFQNGIMMRDGTGLERAADIDLVAFDKTGTLTEGKVQLAGQPMGDAESLAIASSIAALSTHPLSHALRLAAPDAVPMAGEANEIAGQGIEVITEDATWRLGNAAFCGATEQQQVNASQVWLARDGQALALFTFADTARPDAGATVASLVAQHVAVTLLSGDNQGAVAALAGEVGIEQFSANLTPQQKLDRLTAAAEAGSKVMMVGDGINDAPALRAAQVSMAPSSASDIGRSAADFVFTNGKLMSVPFVLSIARRADHLVRGNLGLALVYNLFALPLAVAGMVTPLIAALAMSTSSILVVVNALRLRLGPDLVAKKTPGETP